MAWAQIQFFFIFMEFPPLKGPKIALRVVLTSKRVCCYGKKVLFPLRTPKITFIFKNWHFWRLSAQKIDFSSANLSSKLKISHILTHGKGAFEWLVFPQNEPLACCHVTLKKKKKKKKKTENELFFYDTGY